MIELMIAVLLTAIAMSGIIALFLSQNRASGVSRHTSEASALAQDKLEKLRTMLTATGSSDVVDAQGNAGSANLYTRTWTVTAGSGYSDIRVDVQWEETNGTRTLTVYGRRGS
jgi:Tfp pilus assembly protein PilV